MAKVKHEAKWKQVAARMPVLFKKLPGQEYRFDKDQVAAWVAGEPVLMNMFIDKLRQEGLIVYDAGAGTWRGRDTVD